MLTPPAHFPFSNLNEVQFILLSVKYQWSGAFVLLLAGRKTSSVLTDVTGLWHFQKKGEKSVSVLNNGEHEIKRRNLDVG